MLSVQELDTRIQSLQSRYDREAGILSNLEDRFREALRVLEKVRSELTVGEQVQLLFAKTSEMARIQIKSHVEQTVTAALQAIFGREMRFEIALRDLGNQTAADWRVIDSMEDEEVAGDPEDSRGGGVSDVVSLALRLAVLELVRPRLEGPILLDESGKHISAEHREALGQFLKAYAAKADRQTILISHQEELAAIADVAYHIDRVNGVSEVRRLEL